MPTVGLPSAMNLTEVVEAFRNALRVYVMGDPEPVMSFSRTETTSHSPIPWKRHAAGPPTSETRLGEPRQTSPKGARSTSKRSQVPSKR